MASLIYTEDQKIRLREKLRRRGQLEIHIVSGSMIPAIAVDQCVKVVPLQTHPRQQLKRFDPVVFWNQNGILCCHFFWKINRFPEETYSFRSLREYKEDLPVPASDILGLAEISKPSVWQRWKCFLHVGFD